MKDVELISSKKDVVCISVANRIDSVILECKNIEQTCGGIGFYNSLIIQHQI